MNTGNAIKIFDAGGLKVKRAVPEKHIINFFGLKQEFLCMIQIKNLSSK